MKAPYRATVERDFMNLEDRLRYRLPSRPFDGSQTEHLLEFTDIPVLVVPVQTLRRADQQAGA